MALLILTLPVSWVFAAAVSAGVHELCHLWMLKKMSVPVHAMVLRAGGAVLDTGPMGEKEELLCALAGPVGSFLLLILLHICPRIALCGLVQGTYNLIPLGTMDGARIVRRGYSLLLRKKPCKQGKIRVQ